MTTASPALLWFRQDLRLQDNLALQAAVAHGGPVIPVYIFDEAGEGDWPVGGAARWWRHHALESLAASLGELGSRLVMARGDAGGILARLRRATGAGAVFWNRRYEPACVLQEAKIQAELSAQGVETRAFNGTLLFDPATVLNKQGRPFRVFTAFWRHGLSLPVPAPVRFKARRLFAPARWPESLALADLGLKPNRGWADGWAREWQPGEEGARKRLKAFLAAEVDGYAACRNIPAEKGTSQLSPWLHGGELGVRQVWAAVRARGRPAGVFPASEGERVFLSELGWREFAHYLLHHFPHLPGAPLRPEFARFPWAPDPGGKLLRGWQTGATGYPIVDAGMRQLWRTGWMHNRVRMIAASFLVKHLRQPWAAGAAWFWDTLVDADLANNTLGWQWTAGCGADAAPYFRVFSPVAQGERFDPQGAYVRRWVPELAGLPDEWIHRPWEAPTAILHAAGVRWGETYPLPVVDHVTARAEALAAFRQLRAAPAAASDE
ncbi:MAG: cryptochrome/photolyase family protein [Opitutales bacterium]